MAEISDDSPDPPPPSSSSLLFTTGTATGAPGDGEESKRRTTRPGTKRLFLTLSVFLSFLSGLPFFLKSTEIYRSPLPFDSIDSLSRRLQSDPPSLPCRFHAVFLRSDPGRSLADRLHSSIYDELRRRTAKDLICGGCSKNFSVSVTVDSGTHCVANGAAETCIWRCGLLDSSSLGGDDEVIDGLLDSALEYSRRECSETGSGRVYTVVVVERENGVGEQEVRVVLGKHRHAWIVGMISDTDAVSVIGKIFVKFFMNGGNRRGEMVKSRGDFMPVGADGSLVLSFSLLNAELSDWIYDW